MKLDVQKNVRLKGYKKDQSFVDLWLQEEAAILNFPKEFHFSTL